MRSALHLLSPVDELLAQLVLWRQIELVFGGLDVAVGKGDLNQGVFVLSAQDDVHCEMLAVALHVAAEQANVGQVSGGVAMAKVYHQHL